MFRFGRNIQHVLGVNHSKTESHGLNNGERMNHQGINFAYQQPFNVPISTPHSPGQPK